MNDLIRLCPECSEPINTNYVFSITIRYGTKSIQHKTLCKKCVMQKYDIDNTYMTFRLFLAEFTRKYNLSSWHKWEDKYIKIMIREMKQRNIPILKYDAELWTVGDNNKFTDNIPSKILEQEEKKYFKHNDT